MQVSIPTTSETTVSRTTEHIDEIASKQFLLPTSKEKESHVEVDEVDSLEDGPSNGYRIPLMLRRWVLVTFSVTYLAMIASLEIVHKSSVDKHGFGPITSDLHYIWTYGPTAVFTLVGAFWTQVDYRTRQILPWQELARRPLPASKNLFLDYVSPNPVRSFLVSLKRRHWAVSAVFVGSFLLKVIIVLSTALFTSRPSNLPRPFHLQMVEQLNLNSFNATDVDDTAGSVYTSLLLKQIEFPQGTNKDFAVETFESSERIYSNDYRLAADVNTITASLNCKKATTKSEVDLQCPTGTSCRSDWVTMAAETDDCRIPAFPTGNRTLLVTSATEGNLGPQDEYDYGSWYGDAFLERCAGEGAEPVRDRIVIVSLYKNPGPMLTNSTTLFCEPSISVSRNTVNIDQQSAIRGVGNSISSNILENSAIKKISEGVRIAVDQIPSIEGLESLGNATRKYNFKPFVRLMLSSQNSTSIRDASDYELLAVGANDVYKGLVVQLAKQYLLAPNATEPDYDLNGKISYTHQRLFMQNRPLRIIESFLAVLTMISLFLALRKPKHAAPQDTASIARLCSAISQSSDFARLLEGTGSWPIVSLQGALGGQYQSKFGAHSEPRTWTFTVENHGFDGVRPLDVAPAAWRPFTLSWYTRSALVALPLALVIALEIVYQQSRSNEGLLKIIDVKQTQMGSSYVPAIVMALTKLLFSAFDFDLRILDPYVQLKKGSAAAKPSVLNKTIYTWKTNAFWVALANKRFAVGASTLSVMLASFLTVAVSGLYTATPITRESTINLTRMDVFSLPGSLYRNESTARTARLAAYGKLNPFVGNNGPYVVPAVSVPPDELGMSNWTSITALIPVQRGSLNCSLVDSKQVKLTYPTKMPNQLYMQWPEMIPNCTGQKYYNESVASIIGMKDGPFGRWSSAVDSGFSTCPDSWGVYGTWLNGTATELSVVQCWNVVQQLQASVQFTMPSLEIQTLTVDESTSVDVYTGSKAGVLLSTVFPQVSSSLTNSTSIYYPAFDGPFSSFLRTGRSNDLNVSLTQRGNFVHLYDRIQEVYGLVVARTLDVQGRNATVRADMSLLHATATKYTVRLAQNAVSTRILQGLLACMLICAFISVCALRVSSVLPKNPCSIAAQASLVAGSGMLARMPPEAQFMEDKEFEALFRDTKYTMGWTIGINGKRRFGVDSDDRCFSRD